MIKLFSNNPDLMQAYEEFARLLAERGICQAVTEKLPKDSGVAGVKVYDDIVKKLLRKRKANGRRTQYGS